MSLSELFSLKNHFSEELYINSYYLIGNSLLSASSGFLFWIFAAKFFTTEDVGIGAAIISLLSLIATFSFLGFDVGLVRYLSSEEDKKNMINTCFTLTLLCSILLASISIIGIIFFIPQLQILTSDIYQIVLFFIFTIFLSVSGIQTYVFIAYRKAKYSFFQVFFTLVRLFLLPFMVFLGAKGIYYSAGFAGILAFIFGNQLISKIDSAYRFKFVIVRELFNKIFSYSLKNYIANFFFNLPTFLLPIVVLTYLGASINAFFFIAWSIGAIISAIPLAVSKSLLAEVSYSESNLLHDVKRALSFIFLLIGPIIIIILFFGDNFLLFFGKEYAINSYNLLILFSLAALPYTIVTIYTTIRKIQKKILNVILVYLFIALFSIIFGIILIPIFGILSFGYSWLLANMICVLYVWYAFSTKKIFLQNSSFTNIN